MIKCIKTVAVIATCVMATAATAGGDSQQPAYVNDMPFPAEMPAYTPRVVFNDLPFMKMPATRQAVVFDDMPFPVEMKAYVPMRHYADMPTRMDVLANNADQAMLQISN